MKKDCTDSTKEYESSPEKKIFDVEPAKRNLMLYRSLFFICYFCILNDKLFNSYGKFLMTLLLFVELIVHLAEFAVKV